MSINLSPRRLNHTSGDAVQGVKTLRRTSAAETPAGRASCLTEVSASLLIASAMGVSAVLWLAILVVI